MGVKNIYYIKEFNQTRDNEKKAYIGTTIEWKQKC